MALKDNHNVADDWSATLNATINSAVTSLVLASSGATGAPTVPFYFNVDSEQMRCSAIAVDTPSAGLDTLTMSRGENGTSAASHTAGATVEQNAYAAQVTEIHSLSDRLGYFIASMTGASEGVVRTSAATDCKVVAQGTPGMTVVYSAGACVVSRQPTAILANTNSSTFTAPTGNPRIDTIQIDRWGTVSVKTGAEAGSPSAPAVDADNYKLAEIYHRVGETSIKNTDDASNGYITDSRTFV